MKEHPILFSAPMVRAILDRRKTMTRRVIKLPAWAIGEESRLALAVRDGLPGIAEYVDGRVAHRLTCPYGAPGDRLWVRETWRPWRDPEEWTCVQYQADAGVMKPDTWDEQQGFWCECVGDENVERDAKGMTPRWRPSIHMPRWASRLTLEVTAVRVERVQNISEEDARAEGCDRKVQLVAGSKYTGENCCRHDFANLWNDINAERGYGWDANPRVWVIEFKRAPGARGEG